MTAIQFDSGLKKLSLVAAPIPATLAKNEVVVQVAYSGVCGTDLHIVAGKFPCSEEPFIMGHEFCGIVQDVGSDVTHVKKGDRVAVDPNRGCRACDACHNGDYHFCCSDGLRKRVGTFENGGWAMYSIQPADLVHKLPDSVTLEQAVLTEPLSCIAHAWDLIVPIPVGSHILIVGAGIIGNLWACVLHLQGHRRVTVSEPQKTRRKLFQKLETGFDIITPEELKARKTKDKDWGVDLVIDCSGYAPAMEEALTLLNPGGKLCVFGVASPEARMSVSPYLLYKNELTIVAVKINPFSFCKAVGWIEAMGCRYLDFAKLGVTTYSLDQYMAALEDMKGGIIAKAIFKSDLTQ